MLYISSMYMFNRRLKKIRFSHCSGNSVLAVPESDQLVVKMKERVARDQRERDKVKQLTLRQVVLTLSIHIIFRITLRQLIRVLYCVRACAHDTSDVIWRYMAVNSQRLLSVHMCVVFVAFNK